jgi:hypothetical protein
MCVYKAVLLVFSSSSDGQLLGHLRAYTAREKVSSRWPSRLFSIWDNWESGGTYGQEVSEGLIRKLVQLLSMLLGDNEAMASGEGSDVEEGVAVDVDVGQA